MRMIASDLDGTIIGRDGKISDRTIRAFDRCREAGIEIVFVTGRPPRWLDPVRDQLGHTGTVICSNGAVVYDVGRRRVLDAQVLEYETVMATTKAIRDRFSHAVFAAETIGAFHLEPGFLQPGTSELHQVEPRPLAESLATVTPEDPVNSEVAGTRRGRAAAADPETAVVKLLAKEPDSTPDDFLARVAPLVEHLVSVTHSSPGVALLEMASRRVNKASALQDYAARLGIAAADVVAFGDMPNDVQMLAWAGHGYAMSDGHPDALAAASLRAPSFAEDGVARILEQRLTDLVQL